MSADNSAAEDAALIESDEEIPLHLEDPIKLKEEEKKKVIQNTNANKGVTVSKRPLCLP